MTVAELKELLENMPADAEVWIATECCGCFQEAESTRLDKRGMFVIDSAVAR